MTGRKHNVLILNHSYTAPFIELDRQYVRLFNPNYYQVTRVYLTGSSNPENSAGLRSDIIFLNLRKRDIRRLKFRAVWALTQLCRERSFIMAICHRYKPTYIMSWVSRLCPVPCCLSVMHDFKTLRPFLHKLFVYAALRHQFVFAGVSDAIRDDLIKDGWGLDRRQVITLPNSIEPDMVIAKQVESKTARELMNIRQNVFLFGTVGRLHPAKDHLTLIRAMASIRDSCPHARLVILGTGSLKSTLMKEVERLNLGSRIRFLGFVQDASRLMRGFDVYISSSQKEPFGMVLLEAMAAERPIIATAVDGVPQVMGDVGTLIPPGDEIQLAQAMRTYYNLNHDARVDIGRAGLRRIRHQFSTHHFRTVFWNYFQQRGLYPDGKQKISSRPNERNLNGHS